MKSGMAVYLTQNPKLRGNIARISRDGVWITWHPYVFDVPEALKNDSKINVREGSKRMRVFYGKRDLKYIGLGVPS